LRGDSATLKAVNISALILVAGMASKLDSLNNREMLIATLVQNLYVIAALILCSFAALDLEQTKTAEGRLEWRDLFRGTALARGVPIVSAVAIAVFSAVSPIFLNEIGAAFGSILKAALQTALPNIGK
jgi:hypothetical protein